MPSRDAATPSERLEQLLDEGQVEAALLVGEIVPPLTEREIDLVRQAFDHGYRIGRRRADRDASGT